MDPVEARRFASVLEETARDLRAQNQSISREMVELNAAWSDPKYLKFQHLFDETTLQIASFVVDAEHYAKRLREKAAWVDKYLKR